MARLPTWTPAAYGEEEGDKVADTFSIIADLVIVAGAGIAAFFTAFRYRTSREGAPRPEITVSADVHRLPDVNVVDIAIKVKNAGTVAIVAEAEHVATSFCEVMAVSCPDGTYLHTFEAETVELLLEQVLYLRSSPFNADGEAPTELIEPGTTETYHVMFSTEYKGTAWIHVQFCDNSDWVSRADRMLVFE